MYESTPVYSPRQQGPTTQRINKPEWNNFGDQYAASKEVNKSPGKGERHRRWQDKETRLPHDRN